MKIFNKYLNRIDYMEWEPKRFEQAREDELLDPRIVEPKDADKIPKWLINDLPWKAVQRLQTIPYENYSDIEKRIEIINFLENNYGIVNDFIPKKARYIITLKGEIFSAPSASVIHQHLICYAMLVGKVPMNINLSDYQWSGESFHFGMRNFLCLEKFNQSLYLAESYSDPFEIIILLKEQKNHIYNRMLEKYWSGKKLKSFGIG